MRLARFATLIFLAAGAAEGAVFLVPSDADLVRESSAIVVGTAGSSAGRHLPGRPIETVTEVFVTESIRGGLQAGETIEVVSIGGVVGTEGLLVPGAASFRQGEKVLLFLSEGQARGEWRARDMAVGKFTFTGDLLVRDSGQICGFGSDGLPHREPYRSADLFLRYVAATARGERAAADYVLPQPRAAAEAENVGEVAARTWLVSYGGRPLRWARFPEPVVFHSNGVQPNAVGGGLPAAKRGMAAWTDDPISNIVYQYGGTTTVRTAFRGADRVNSILFNDPGDELSQPGVLAFAGIYFSTTSSHVMDGQEFLTIVEADVVVQNDLSLPGVAGPGFDRVLTHELGHTLGLRHADSAPGGGAASVAALMTATLDFHRDAMGAVLQSWDRDAIASVYGTTSAVSCSPPRIVTEPTSSAFHGAPVTLSVDAVGSGPLRYQWFIGSRGDTSLPIEGATTSMLMVAPHQTTSYWALVTGGCSPAAESAAATVMVGGCAGVSVSAVSTSATILQGRAHTLSVSAESAGRSVTVRWYAGARGDRKIHVGTGPAVTVTPAATTHYWAEVQNDCGARATTESIMIAFVPCTAPQFLTQPARADAVIGDTISLVATVRGSQPLVLQWFEGYSGDTARPVLSAVTESATSPRIQFPTAFWLRARNECGEARTVAGEVGVVGSCVSPGIRVQPADQSALAGMSAIVSVDAGGPSLTYRWFEGPVGDRQRPVGLNSPYLVTPPIHEPTRFWVEIRNSCGSVTSTAALVTPASTRRRASSP